MEFTEQMFSRNLGPITGSAIREIFHLLGKPGMISFAGGNPAESALDVQTVGELAAEALGKYGTKILQYGATEGFGPLKESVAAFYRESCDVKAEASNTLIVQGSQQGLDLLLKALVNPGDAVLAEDPTFLGALQAMRTYGANVISMPTDEGGAILAAAEALIREHRPKLMYVIPTFQNPTGVTLVAGRRRGLAELAAKYGVVLCEDDPYRDLRYSGEALPAVASYDAEGWVAYMGSFSKLIAPGLRVGAVVANPTLIRKLTICKQSADVHSPSLPQAIVDGYLRRGLLMPHIENVRGGYAAQLNAMLEGFEHFPKGTAHTRPEGGLFVWAELPGGLNAKALLTKAVERGVAYVPGTHFYAGGGHENTLRLNFSNAPECDIRRGMRALGEAFSENMEV